MQKIISTDPPKAYGKLLGANMCINYDYPFEQWLNIGFWRK